eukprot:scaffold9348_cov82-Cyclotella_meneghiniana.AAC.7
MSAHIFPLLPSCRRLSLVSVDVQRTGALVLLTNTLLPNATVSESQERGRPRRRLFVVVAATIVGL